MAQLSCHPRQTSRDRLMVVSNDRVISETVNPVQAELHKALGR
ncbi:hypothetical protein [Streptomyces sp. NPDC057909]